MLQVRRFVSESIAGGRPAMLLLLPLLVIGPAVALIVAHRFDGLYGQDAYAYSDYALGPLRDRLLALQPPPPFFWPPGYPLLVALASLLPGIGIHAGQVVSLIAGGAVPVFTLLLAREVWPGDSPSRAAVPLLAGIVVALDGQLWQSSIVVMSDTLGLAAGTLGVWALARYGRGRRGGWLVLASAALAWAVLTRWAYALVAVPAAVYALWLLRPYRPAALAQGGAALLVAVAVLGPMWQPTAQALLSPDEGIVAFAGSLQVHPWDPLNAFRREFVTADGLVSYRLPNGLYYAIMPARPFYLTPLLLALVVPGAWTVLRRRGTAAARLLVAWTAMLYGFHAGSAIQNMRFILAYVPPLAILAAIGAEALARRLGGRWRWAPAALIVAGITWMIVGGVSLNNDFIARMDRLKAIVPWMEEQIPSTAHLLSFGLTMTLEHESALDVHELYLMDVLDVQAVLDSEGPTYLLIDVSNVETQWRDEPPDENYAWLRTGPGLTALGNLNGYTLFRVDE